MKILIIKLGALGDVIISTAIIKQILDHHKNSDIKLLTTPAFEDLFSGFEKLQTTAFKRKGLLNTLKTISWIRRENFDRIYDLQSNDRSSIYCALSKAPFRAGNHPRFPYHAHPDNTFIGECHSFDRLNQILKSANISPARAEPYLSIPENIKTDVKNWLINNNLTEKQFVILHAGSSALHLKKRWPYFSELAKILSEKMTVIWIGGNDDIELNRLLSEKTGIDATNRFSILALVELGKKAMFAVTNDSAPMHALSCSRIPVFGIFGPTYARRTHALGQLENVITKNNEIAQNDNDFKPDDISNVSLETVLDKLKKQQLI